MTSLDELLDERHILVCTGAGGVGKTTTSAALALRAADRGRRVVVCTIDPARRLAQSLGLDSLGNTPVRVQGATRKGGRGELHAMMLDMKRTFDEMVLDMTTPTRAEHIFANPFYQHISSTLSGTQEYMAMEKLWELHEEGRWELIVIDTPPTRHALDFLDAPRRVTDFLEGRVLRLFLWPYLKAGKSGLRAFSVGTRTVLKTVTKVTGSELFADVATFFQVFEGMYDTFKQRAARVHDLLGARRTAFIVVTSPDEAPLREARYFVQRLREEKMPLGGVIVNRTHDVEQIESLERAAGSTAELPEPLRSALDVYRSWQTAARREEAAVGEALAGLGRRYPIWRAPDLADDVVEIGALRTVGELLAGGHAPLPLP